MCMYMYTYVYVVLSDGTRGCCGLIYRLSLPWKPRRDRLARHPHIRVDSGLLYSPPRTSRSLLLSLSFLLALYASLYLSLALALLRPPRLLTPFVPPASFPVLLSPPDFISPLLSFFTVRDLCPPSSRATPNSIPLSLYVLLRTSSCLSKRVFLSDSFVLSFFSESLHLVFTFPTLPF